MIRFAPLAGLTVRHDYHGPGAAPIDLVPDMATKALAARPDLRLRIARGRAEVFAPEDRPGLVGLAAGGALAFTFRLFPVDPQLMTVTEAVADARDAIAVLDLAEPSEHVVGDGDLRPLRPDDLVSGADARLRPLSVVRLAADPNGPERHYTVRFQAVARFWTYHVIGGGPEAAFRVRDRAGEVGFRTLGERLMANGARARSFRSEVAIPASARPMMRFELVSEGPFGPRSIVETLPCPRPGPGGIDSEDAATGPASDIYVNL